MVAIVSVNCSSFLKSHKVIGPSSSNVWYSCISDTSGFCVLRSWRPTWWGFNFKRLVRLYLWHLGFLRSSFLKSHKVMGPSASNIWYTCICVPRVSVLFVLEDLHYGGLQLQTSGMPVSLTSRVSVFFVLEDLHDGGFNFKGLVCPYLWHLGSLCSSFLKSHKVIGPSTSNVWYACISDTSGLCVLRSWSLTRWWGLQLQTSGMPVARTPRISVFFVLEVLQDGLSTSNIWFTCISDTSNLCWNLKLKSHKVIVSSTSNVWYACISDTSGLCDLRSWSPTRWAFNFKRLVYLHVCVLRSWNPHAAARVPRTQKARPATAWSVVSS